MIKYYGRKKRSFIPFTFFALFTGAKSLKSAFDHITDRNEN